MKSAVVIFLLFFPCAAYGLETEKVIEKYPNGNKKIVATYHHEDKLKEVHYFENGSKQYVKNYFWGMYPFGAWGEYSKKGVAVDSGSFIIGDDEQRFLTKTPKGTYREYYPNGKLKLEVFFKQKALQGVLKKYHENGSLNLEGDIINGLYLTNQKTYNDSGQLTLATADVNEYRFTWSYHSNGSIAEERVYSYDRRIIFRKYYENQHIKEEILEPSDSIRCMSYFHENGLLRLIRNYINDKENGNFISYFSDGSIKVRGNISQGIFTGPWIWFYENGTLMKNAYFTDDGEHDGDYVEYYDNGKIKVRARFDKKILSGNYLEYDNGGKVIRSITPKEGDKYNFWFGRSGPDNLKLIIKSKTDKSEREK